MKEKTLLVIMNDLDDLIEKLQDNRRADDTKQFMKGMLFAYKNILKAEALDDYEYFECNGETK